MKLSEIAAAIKPLKIVSYFDKLQFRTAHPLTRTQLDFLSEHSAKRADQKLGSPINNSYKDYLITVVAPDDEALHWLAQFSEFMPNWVEVALDFITADIEEAQGLHDLLDLGFVQNWHRGHDLAWYSGKVPTNNWVMRTATINENRNRRAAGTRYVWYHDRPSKRLGGPCLHLEGRHQGVTSVRPLGIHSPADLIGFDFRAYWERRLKVYEIDLERLGRFDSNRRAKSKRSKPLIVQSGSYFYNRDLARGSALFRGLSENREKEFFSVQRFVDAYGRGPFLHEIDLSAFLPC